MLEAIDHTQQGARIDGEQPADTLQPFLVLTTHAYALLGNGMGGINWAGLEVIAEHLGITDIHRLIDCLMTMKTHQPAKDAAGKPDA